MTNVMDIIAQVGIVPVVKINDVTKAVPLANALVAGGINVAEITFRTSCAAEAIAKVSTECPDMVVGAGTVLNVAQAKQAIDAGAKFIVSPGYSRDVVKYCQSQGVAVLPGCITPTEIMMALEDGLSVVKFFPAKEFGGLPAMKALSAPFAQVKFMPTGGVSLENLAEFISAKFIYACGGTFMVKATLINEGKFEEITKLSKLATDIVKEIRG